MPGIRHALLEAALRRLARHPDAEAFVLRGGMRVRQLVPHTRRPALDADLVCRLPFDPEATRARFAALLAEDAGDGIRFAPELAVESWWRPTNPALRLVVEGEGARVRGRAHLDLTFGLALWPPPTPVDVGTRSARRWLWTCRPETLVARKLQVVTSFGRAAWRPKDLRDLEQVLSHAALDREVLAEAIRAVLAATRTADADAREVFAHPDWFRGAASGARWQAFADRDPLEAVVATVRAHLLPALSP